MKFKNVSPLLQFILICFVADTKSSFEKRCVERINFCYLHLLTEHSKRANYNVDCRKIDTDNVFRPS